MNEKLNHHKIYKAPWHSWTVNPEQVQVISACSNLRIQYTTLCFFHVMFACCLLYIEFGHVNQALAADCSCRNSQKCVLQVLVIFGM